MARPVNVSTPVDTGKPVAAAPASTSKDDAETANDFNRMRDYFAKQPKVMIRTREDEWVQINGYTFIIKGNTRVEVPEDVANLLEETGRI